MPEEIKNDFSGGLNLDDSPFRTKPNEYVGALNISKNSIVGLNDKAVTNVVGNQLVNYIYTGGGINTTIGAKEHPLRNTVIEFVFNNIGKHSIIEYNNTTRVRTKIFENLTDSGNVDILGFVKTKKITSINIYPREIEGDLLFFIDSLGRPTVLNIEKFKNSVFTPVTRDIIDVAKCPPLSPPTNVRYDNDNLRRSNSLRNRKYRFKYRYVDIDFYKTTCSPLSEIPIEVNILDEIFTSIITNNNCIKFDLFAGNKGFTKIEVLMSYVNKSNDWSNFVLIDTIDQTGLAEGSIIPYTFYNDGVYPPIDPNESIQLFDYVPDKANCQELLDGNILGYAGITEGYDKDLIPNVTLSMSTYASGGSLPTGSLDAVVQNFPTAPFFSFFITFSGNPIAGTLIQIYLRYIATNTVILASSYTTILGDTATTVTTALRNNFIFVPLVSANGTKINVIPSGAIIPQKRFESIIITPPGFATGNSSVPTFPFSETKRVALVYFDKKGKTNGVLYNEQFVTPQYSENISQQLLLPNLNAKIYHVPPIWAHSFQWLMTKSNTNYIYWYTINVNTSESDFIYLNITNFATNQKKFPTTKDVLNYSFKDGDRVRIIKRDSDNVVFNDTYDAKIEGVVTDPLINGSNTPSVGQYIKIRKVSPISTIDFSSNQFIIQIYSPAQQQATGSDKTQTYFEISREYKIINPTTIARYHTGEVTNQNISSNIPAEFNFKKGDAYFRPRKTSLSESGIAVFSVLDRNIVDFYISAVNNIDGRPNLIEENARKAYFPTVIRFGQAYQANTNINGFNRFYSNNFDEYDLSFGDIMRLKIRGRTLKVFQKLNIGVVPLFNQISKNADGTTLNVVTDKLLNPIQYRVGGIGIGENAESLVSNRFADYFTDNIKGLICRDSNNGTEAISVLYKVNSFASKKIPLRKGNFKIYGTYDQVLNNYIVALEATESDEAYTLIFNEETNRFDSFVSYKPEMMVTLGTLLITFKDGQLYTHDNPIYNIFYGTRYESEIEPVFNTASTSVKSFMALEENSNELWVVPEIETSMISYGIIPQQSNLIEQDFTPVEGKFVSPLLKDSNSIGGINGGDQLKGNWLKMKLKTKNSNRLFTTNFVSLNLVSLRVIDSPLNNK